MEFRTLGRVEAIGVNGELPLGGPKPRTILAALLLSANTPVTTDRLCDMLWAGNPPASARANVRSYAARLRCALNAASEGDRLSPGHQGYLLRVQQGELDLWLFDELVARGRAAMADGDHESAAEELRAALDLWRGAAFDGLAHHDALHIEVSRLEESRFSVFEDYAAARVALGEYEELVPALQARTALHPLRERLWVLLMTAQHCCGRTGDALRSYARARRALRDELGLDPGAELRQLHEAILASDLPPDVRSPPAPARPGAGPRLAGVWPVCQLPTGIPDFVGREQLLARAAALLVPSNAKGSPTVVPTVILTGLPGVGKTAAATHLAHRLRDTFPEGQLYVQLDGPRGAHRTSTTVLADLLLSIGVPGSAIPRAESQRAALFRSKLAGRRVLVVLDNVLDASQVRPLLPGGDGCAVLITSRARLTAIPGAHLLDVKPLDDTDGRTLLDLIVGARRFATEPEATERILADCAGLPLALRVAGARLVGAPHRPVRWLADRLADEQRRLGELRAGDLAVRACVTTAYHGLAPDAARMFRVLGLLPTGEFPSWAPAALMSGQTGHEEPDDRVDDILDSLVHANLVWADRIDPAGRPRYRMHDLLRAHAAERAAEEESLAQQREMVAHVLDGWLLRVRAAGEKLVRAGADAQIAWLEYERSGLVATVECAARSGHGERASELAAALDDICHLRNWWDDWERMAQAVLAQASADGDRRRIAMAQGSLARADAGRGRAVEAVRWFTSAIEQSDALGERRQAAYLRVYYSFAIADRGMAEEARTEASAAVSALCALDDLRGAVLALRSLGSALICGHREAEAERVLKRALEAAERLGQPLALADVLQALAVAEIALGRYRSAARHLDRALPHYRAVGHRPGEAYALITIGRLRLTQRPGDPGQAAEALGPLTQAAKVFSELGEVRGEALTAYMRGRGYATLGDQGRARGCFGAALTAFSALRMPDWEKRTRHELGNLGR
ncbi:AfsR/SARP family transcriptional regulator [Streptomyces sp. ME19-01-6]|uniref:AfsR/SARP family transcriptional regulator n=1 Tax=Streptomyces sp. ME19-01-6 TaxID=3028686 RepID=UPI0029A29362|nr:BTAD domain-containing putative transcriptional regulator [Streptomyces sp. ME19-01-6]MDX3225381.1 BTAD domain-containing putative transcriptional regulator [Streptomyces sp. ME19-01-6]